MTYFEDRTYCSIVPVFSNQPWITDRIKHVFIPFGNLGCVSSGLYELEGRASLQYVHCLSSWRILGLNHYSPLTEKCVNPSTSP